MDPSPQEIANVIAYARRLASMIAQADRRGEDLADLGKMFGTLREPSPGSYEFTDLGRLVRAFSETLP